MKDHIRDYATEAFRFYASVRMTADQYKKMIYDETLENYKKKEMNCSFNISKPVEAAIMAAEKEVDKRIAEIRDLEAVEMTLAELGAMHRWDIVQAIKIVYFKEPEEEIEKGEIQNRVHTAELEVPASERSIYYYLRKARKLFAEKRGLRI
ncbi:hypothetical protein AGR56_09050 [Clostridium sp. DMHC 10]|uniref:hypothetical protein n=1 Tax=Clostridium sp. DMHC 10 TaxID=747377 RepID=UPI00069E2929|nr:hypothetical protein [Clostridium sp. DMHC 10]KOF56802.1 hypothetical protein AGR56_09050 [Clostridium sp. DMHC 10]